MIECGHLIVQVFLQLLFKRAYRRRPGVRGGTRDGANHIGNPPLRHIDLVRDHLDGILKRLKGFICISRGNLSVHPDGGQRIPDLVCHPRDNARDMGFTLKSHPAAFTCVDFLMSEKIAVAASRSPESANNGVTLHAMVLIPLSVVSTVSNSRWNVLLSMRAVSRAPTIERRVDISPLEASSLMGTCERSRSPIPKRFRACLLMNRIRRSESTAITADPRSWRSRYIS